MCTEGKEWKALGVRRRGLEGGIAETVAMREGTKSLKESGDEVLGFFTSGPSCGTLQKLWNKPTVIANLLSHTFITLSMVKMIL